MLEERFGLPAGFCEGLDWDNDELVRHLAQLEALLKRANLAGDRGYYLARLIEPRRALKLIERDLFEQTVQEWTREGEQRAVQAWAREPSPA